MPSGATSHAVREEHIEYGFIGKLQGLKYEHRYARCVEMAEIEKNDFNLNISRYISTAVGEACAMRRIQVRSRWPASAPSTTR